MPLTVDAARNIRATLWFGISRPASQLSSSMPRRTMYEDGPLGPPAFSSADSIPPTKPGRVVTYAGGRGQLAVQFPLDGSGIAQTGKGPNPATVQGPPGSSRACETPPHMPFTDCQDRC